LLSVGSGSARCSVPRTAPIPARAGCKRFGCGKRDWPISVPLQHSAVAGSRATA
jgi:hypothetical protein